MTDNVVNQIVGCRVQLGILEDSSVEPIIATVVGMESRAIRVETDDERILALDGYKLPSTFFTEAGLLETPVRVTILLKQRRPILLSLLPEGDSSRLERREWLRVPAKVTVRFTLPDGTEVSTPTLNLSAGGALLSESRGLDGGMELQVEVDLGRERLLLDSRVVSLTSDGKARIAFFNPSEAAKKRLLKFVFDTEMAAIRESNKGKPLR